MVRTTLPDHHRGDPLITLQRRQLVGHDILLARHGNHISSMRVDRGNGTVVALLDDGSVDTAPNMIAPDLNMPHTVRSVMREDWKLLSIMTGAAAAWAALMVGAAVVIASSTGNTAALDMMYAYPGY
ncbi:hypothetical protein GA0061083_3712 [Pseudarthrobacter enclensis]|jgi:hypothetical protein|nr:hypothetical protein GA0061083_3712 [Pseudarthrobacter enclensis]